MARKYLAQGPGTKPRVFLIIFFLLFNSLSWFFITRRIIYAILNDLNMTYQQNLLIWGIYDLAIIGASIAGSILSGRIKRLTFLYLWMLLGTIASVLLSFFYLSLAYILSVSFLWSISFGIGMPLCLAYFTEYTVFENRGRTAGIIVFAASISTPLVVMLSTMNLTMSIIASTVWRGIGLIVLLLLKPKEQIIPEKRKYTPFTSILHDKNFLLYLIPWLMFSFIFGFQRLVFEHFLAADFYDFLRIIESIVGTISALIGGLVADWIGRKRVVIYGFTSLGLAYAAVGIAPNSLISLYFFSVIDGIAWGVFLAIFVLVLWGDLSYSGAREKYYAIGSIPFFFADFIGFLFTPFVAVPPSAAFSVASLFLFLAVLPLMYAPETLPEKKIKLRQLRKYLEKAKKVEEKYAEKGR